MSTLEQLQRRYTRPYLTLAEFRADHLAHIATDRHLLRLIEEGTLPLRITKLHASNRAERVITLAELSRWLDATLSDAESPAAAAA